jgi:hypothetical protein
VIELPGSAAFSSTTGVGFERPSPHTPQKKRADECHCHRPQQRQKDAHLLLAHVAGGPCRDARRVALAGSDRRRRQRRARGCQLDLQAVRPLLRVRACLVALHGARGCRRLAWMGTGRRRSASGLAYEVDPDIYLALHRRFGTVAKFGGGAIVRFWYVVAFVYPLVFVLQLAGVGAAELSCVRRYGNNPGGAEATKEVWPSGFRPSNETCSHALLRGRIERGDYDRFVAFYRQHHRGLLDLPFNHLGAMSTRLSRSGELYENT